MKKSMLFFVFLMMISLSWGQLSFGITGGVNLANYGGGDVDQINPDSKAGIAGGIFAELKLLNLSVAPELLYVRAGSKWQGTDGTNQISYDDKLSYIQIPVLARFYLPMIAIHPYVTAGPYFNYLVDASTTLTLNGVENTIDSQDRFKKQDVGVKIGVGVKLLKFSAAVRYSLGLTKIDKNADVKNKAVELMVSLYF
jgi:hypothetical protein